MKKTLYIFALLGLLFGACDKVEEPFLEPLGTGGSNKITVNVEFLNDLSGSYNLNVFIIENNIISAQKNSDAGIGPSPDWLDYEHNHMLRASLTGTWGFALSDDPTSGTMISNEYSFSIEDDWVLENLDFLVFITNNDDFGVLQAAETSISAGTVKAAGKVILLEEFTGHTCINCPDATLQAHNLKEKYGEELLLLAIHAGDLAKPSESPYEADYRTDAGTGLINEFQPLGVPMGMVNRTKYDGSITLFKDSWEPAIQALIQQPQEVSIDISVELSE